LPTATQYEAGGLFINQEGRLQVTRQAYKGGLSIVESGAGGHPPRIYGSGIPAADTRPAWKLLADLADKNVGTADDRVLLADIIPEIADLPSWDDISDDGVRLQSAANTDLRFKGQHAFAIDEAGARDSGLELILVDWTFGTEELSAYSSCLRELGPEPTVIMHTSEAKSLNLVGGDLVSIQTQSGKLEAKLKTAKNMAAGVLVIPRHRKLSWQIFETGSVSIGRDQIKKVAT
jgi:NADH-quinone oxidoreductase subunit G